MSEYLNELRSAEARWSAILAVKPVHYGAEIPTTARTAVAIGSGCALPVAKLMEVLLNQKTAVCAQTCTPFQVTFSSICPEIAYFITAKGHHNHILRAYEAAMSRGVHAVIITCSPKSLLLDLASKYPDKTSIILSDCWTNEGGFIPVESTLVLANLLNVLPRVRTNPVTGQEQLFQTARRHHEEFLEQLKALPPETQYQLFCSNWASPAGWDFQTRMAESGIASTTINDPWNFAHGRYMPFHLEPNKNVGIAMLVNGEQTGFENIQRFQVQLSLFFIAAPFCEFFGALYCLIRSMLLVGHIANGRGIDPALPHLPKWGTDLYRHGDAD